MDKTARAPALRDTELYFRKNLAENMAATKHFYQLAADLRHFCRKHRIVRDTRPGRQGIRLWP